MTRPRTARFAAARLAAASLAIALLAPSGLLQASPDPAHTAGAVFSVPPPLDIPPDPASLAGTDEEELIAALSRWVDVAMGQLSVPGGPRPSRVVLAASDAAWYQATATFGALAREEASRGRPSRVEVVVGDDTLNSSRYAVRDPNLPVLRTQSLSVDPVPASHDRDLWFSVDRAYKAAISRLQVKSAARAVQGGDPPPPDWTPAPPVRALAGQPLRPPPADDLRTRAITASSQLRDLPGLRDGTVRIRSYEANYFLVTSEGTRLVQPEGYTAVSAQAAAVRPDGVEVAETRQWVVRTPADLADLALDQAVEALGRRVVARLQAPAVDAWEGPVVFEGDAAADFFRYLVVPEVRGTPPEPSPDRTYRELTRDGPRLGRRLLPPGWSVRDDPTRSMPGLAGGYTWDREGVAGQAALLVSDGYVRDLLMTRVPRLEIRTSNGHARGAVTGDWIAGPSLWEVVPPRSLRPRRFDREVDRAVDDAGLDRVLVVRSLLSTREGTLPRPGDAVWRFADGHEEPVLSLKFQKVDRRTLRDVVAASGAQRARPYVDPGSNLRSSDTDVGLPTVVVAPERILVSEMEAVFPGPDEKPALYPQPPLR